MKNTRRIGTSRFFLPGGIFSEGFIFGFKTQIVRGEKTEEGKDFFLGPICEKTAALRYEVSLSNHLTAGLEKAGAGATW